MKATLLGQIEEPAVTIVGVWDPFLPGHRHLFAEVCTYARQHGLASLAVVLDPNPVTFIYGLAEAPVYDDIRTRIQLMYCCGFDAILHVRFAKSDLNAGPGDFLDLVQAFGITIKELWLGARQLLGRGPESSMEALHALCERREIQIRRLPHAQLETEPVRHHLRAGCLVEATRLVGRPPLRSKPRSGKCRLAWSPGLYHAVPLDTPERPCAGRTCIDVTLTAERGRLSAFSWPDRTIPYLAFIAGPGDR